MKKNICKALGLLQAGFIMATLVSPLMLFWIDWEIVFIFNSISFILIVAILYVWRYIRSTIKSNFY